ncbi:MAG: purine nucleoside phosphorylase YfiH [Gammaproteobacteria bacterium]|nr:MAG: purine nucleoside phosphorylase YfiH [Gammaproteobacteria bacterium]
MSKDLKFIYPDWSAPKNIKAITTTRVGGVSCAPFDSFNLGDCVGDNPDDVRRNRALLHETLNLPSDPVWLKQMHGTNVVDASKVESGVEADGGYTDQPGVVCAVLTADCLPVFLCDKEGTKVGLLHAGWRGLAAGIIEAGIRRMRTPAAEILAWLGPGIGPASYEIGDEVRQAFIQKDPDLTGAFAPSQNGRWLADLYALARRELHAQGVRMISGGDHCTLRESELFFSHRRDGTCGRMASLIWLDESR